MNVELWQGRGEGQLSPNDVYPVRDAVYNAYHSGHFLTTAAGNDDRLDGVEVFPASLRGMVISATAVGCDRSRPVGYQSGPNVDIAAPGSAWDDVNEVSIAQIVTTYLEDEYYGIDRAPYGATSAANPHVAGSAGLLLSHTPAPTNEDIREVLQRTAQDLGDIGWDELTGHGLLRIDSALSVLDQFELVHDSTSTLSPKPMKADSCVLRTWSNIAILGTYSTFVGNTPVDYYTDKYCLRYAATVTDVADEALVWTRGRECVSAIDLGPEDSYDGLFWPYTAAVDSVVGETAYLHGHTYRFWTNSSCTSSLGWYPLKLPLPAGGLSGNTFSWSYLEDTSSREGAAPTGLLGISDGQSFVVRAGPTPLRFYSPSGSDSRLAVYDVTGRQLAEIEIPGRNTPGWKEVLLDPRDVEGVSLPSGVYMARLRAGEHQARFRIVVAR